MRLLLDTHTFMWWDQEPKKLSSLALEYCSDFDNQLIISVVSLWELQIKHRLGKLKLRDSLATIIRRQESINRAIVLPVMPVHIFELENLPAAHKDPFDRLLIAQAIVEGVSIVSADSIFASYPIRVLW